MIQLKLLKNLLNTSDQELQKLALDQLRTLLGVFRYFVRILEREINMRETAP